jgi:CheY-like chemotaxis protein
VLDLRQYGFETAGIEVVRDLDPHLPLVGGDRGSLQRVLLALLRQAERALRAETPGRRVTVRTRESTDGITVCVRDNGPGLPRERLRTLLTTATREDEGDGLGLATALDIVREHGGHLWAESADGEGTAFFLRLPRYEEVEAAPPEELIIPSTTVRTPPSRPLRVLVADDEATLRLALALFLSRHGHEVVQAADAYEAHRLALAQEFDAVIVDAHMPGDGLVLLERLEEIPRLKGRTVLMTGDDRALGEGAADRLLLSKPFDMTEVIRLVETIGR